MKITKELQAMIGQIVVIPDSDPENQSGCQADEFEVLMYDQRFRGISQLIRDNESEGRSRYRVVYRDWAKILRSLEEDILEYR